MIKTKRITKGYKPAIGDFIIDPIDEALGVIFKPIVKGEEMIWAVYWTHLLGDNLETTESVYTLESFLLVEA
jgi:hypothetical protein